MPGNPYLVRWTAHALAKVEILGIDRAEIERAIIEYDHVRRQTRARLPGGSTLDVSSSSINIPTRAIDPRRVVTVWRKR